MNQKENETDQSIQDKILDAILNTQKENEPPKKWRRIIAAIFRVGLLAFIIWFFFFKKEIPSNIEGLEEYKQMLIEDHLRSEKNQQDIHRLNLKDEEVTKRIIADSTAVYNGSDSYRDSLRAIYNPR